MEKCTAIVLAAGQGKRMNTSVQKQYLHIQGYPVLYYSLNAFQQCPWINELVVVTGASEKEFCRKEIVERYGFTKVSAIVAGGAERYHSVQNGLEACSRDTDYVFIHDGARPMLNSEILERGFQCVKQYGACAAGMPSKDTVKIADAHHLVQSTPDRQFVWVIQTPQVFLRDLVTAAYERALRGDCSGITDDAMVVEQYAGHPVALYEGSYENIKITTPEDLEIAELFLRRNDASGLGKKSKQELNGREFRLEKD